MSTQSSNTIQSLLVFAVLIFTLSACGGGGNSESPTDATGASTNAATGTSSGTSNGTGTGGTQSSSGSATGSSSSGSTGTSSGSAAQHVDICTSHFVETTPGTIISDWNTALGCSDLLVRDTLNGAQDQTNYTLTISPQSVLSYSNTDYGNGTSIDELYGIINLRSGHIINYGTLYSNSTAASTDNPFNYAGQGPGIFHGLDTSTSTDTVTFDNYGQIGIQDSVRAGSAIAFDHFTRSSTAGKPQITLNNYGAIWSTNLFQNFGAPSPSGVSLYAPGPTPTLINHPGAIVGTTTGSASNSGNLQNYLDAGLVDTIWSWSWCSHGNSPLSFNNWGYCIAAENAIEWEGHSSSGASSALPVNLYGGPLVASAHDFNGNLIFNGSVSANMQYSDLRADLCQGFPGSAPILVDGANANVALNLYNTVWTYTDPDGGGTAQVNYLPLIYGYPIVGDTSVVNYAKPINLQINFVLDGLTASQQSAISNEISAANSNPFYAITSTNTKTGSYGAGSYTYSAQVPGVSSTMVANSPWQTNYNAAVQLGGYAYRWCGVLPPTVAFTNTNTNTSSTDPDSPLVPQVYYYLSGTSGRQYFTNSNGQNQSVDSAVNNPYFLVNPSTVQQNFVPAVASVRNFFVGPGWTWQLGGKITSNRDQAPPLFPTAVPNNTTSTSNVVSGVSLGWGPSDVVTVESAAGHISNMALLDPDTLAAYQAAGNTKQLIGALVVDDFYTDSSGNPETITLPSLAGSGRVIQSGLSTTVLAASNPNYTGDFVIGNGKLKVTNISSFSTAPSFLFGNHDGAPDDNAGPTMPRPVLDLSGLSGTFVVRGLSMVGPQAPSNWQNGSYVNALSYPSIAGPSSGSLTLQVGTTSVGSNLTQNKFAGILTGAIGVNVSAGNQLDLGFASFQAFNLTTHQFNDLSTYSGGVTVSPGASLRLLSRGALGQGGLTNNGSVELVPNAQYFPALTVPSSVTIGAQWIAEPAVLSTTPALQPALFANRTVFVQGAYTQSSSGVLKLGVRGPDPDANLGSGAGFLYETLAATGPVSLSGTLNLIVHEGFTIPASGMTLPLIFSSGAISGNFSSIQITDAQTKLTRTGTILSQIVRNQTNPGTGQATNMLVITFQ